MKVKHRWEEEHQHEDKLGFTWEIIAMTERSLELQLDFEHPSYISMTELPESLEIQINGGQFFFSAEGVTIELTKIHKT